MNRAESDRSAVAALDEPTRRRVYELIAESGQPLGRDEVAARLELPRTTATFHLERLADEGLLDVTHVRRSGRSGPGAGRPAKLYRRSDREFTVSIPPRQYEWVGRLLAAAIEESVATGEPAGQLLGRHAYDTGVELGKAVRPANIEDTLRAYGFEPRTDPHTDTADLILGNCPFRSLAADYPSTVCGMNLHLLRGLLDGLEQSRWAAELDPGDVRCCVRLRPFQTDRSE